MPLPYLVEEASWHVADGHKLSSLMLKRTLQLDSKMGCMVASWHKGVELISGVFVMLWLRLIGLQLDFKCYCV